MRLRTEDRGRGLHRRVLAVSIPARVIIAVLCALKIGGTNLLSQEGAPLRPSVRLELPGSRTPLATSDALREWVATDLHEQLGLESTEDLEIETEPTRLAGSSVYRLQQKVAGLPVVYRESRLVVSALRVPLILIGQHESYPDPPSETPTLEIAEAVAVLGAGDSPPLHYRLVFLPLGGTLRLSYEVEGSFDEGSAQHERVYVDAHTGVVLDRLPLIYQALARRLYDFRATCASAKVRRPIGMLRSMGFLRRTLKRQLVRDDVSGPSGLDYVDPLFELTGEFHRFLEATLEMDSYDDKGATLSVIAGVSFDARTHWPQCVGNEFNGFWNLGLEAVVLAIGASRYPEFVGHEFGHAVIDSGSRLIYKAEPGALNEAVSDTVGIAFRSWVENGGRLVDSSQRGTWQMRGPKGPLRDFRNPRVLGGLPNHYSDYRRVRYDNGGVHINSSIINQGFYLLAMGGPHPDRPGGPEVEGVGLAKAVRIFGQAAFHLLTPNAGFRDARSAFAYAARLQFGRDSAEWVATHTAMDAIGIPGYWTRPPPAKPADPPESDATASKPELRTDTERERLEDPPDPEPEPPTQGDPGPEETSQQQPPPRRKADVKEPPRPSTPAPIPTTPVEEHPSKQAPVPEPTSLDPVVADPTSDPRTDPQTPSPGDQRASLLLAILIVCAIAATLLWRIRARWTSRDPSAEAVSNGRLRQQRTGMPDAGRVRSLANGVAVVAGPRGFLIPSDASESIPLRCELLASSEGLVLGRSRQLCHVEIRDPHVSRRHARLRLNGDEVWVEDMNSAGGTRVGSCEAEPFRPLRIRDGQSLRIAGYCYRFSMRTSK